MLSSSISATSGVRDAPRERAGANLPGEAPARGGGEQLGIPQPAHRPRRVEDHRRGDDRPGQRPAARLVDAGDQHATPAARSSAATASAASAPVSAVSAAAKPANSASSRRRVTVSS